MIVKLDHIAYACTLEQMDELPSLWQEYRLSFRCRANNLLLKKPLMENYTSFHELMMLQHENKELPPIELTAYEQLTNGAAPLRLAENGCMELSTPKPEATASFLGELGFRQADNKWLFRSFFHPTATYVVLKQDCMAQPWRLDRAGFCCMAFVCDATQKEHERLSLRYACTETAELRMEDRKVSLFFVQGPCGELVEILSPIR